MTMISLREIIALADKFNIFKRFALKYIKSYNKISV